MTQNWKTLAPIVRERRRQLGLTQADIAAVGGPSSALVRQVENGRYDADMQPAMKAGYERALQWAPGSMDAALRGGNPLPMEASRAPVRENANKAYADSTEEDLADLAALYRVRLREAELDAELAAGRVQDLRSKLEEVQAEVEYRRGESIFAAIDNEAERDRAPDLSTPAAVEAYLAGDDDDLGDDLDDAPPPIRGRYELPAAARREKDKP